MSEHFFFWIIRNCRVKYFKDQGAIKACADSGLIAKNILDQCPAKDVPLQDEVEDENN